MLAQQRQARIVEEIQSTGAVRVSDLTRLLGVSEMTVRRDLEALASQGLLDKVHGGATLLTTTSMEEPGFEAKWLREQSEKDAIADLAATYARAGLAVGVSAGTTTWTLAHRLRDIPGLTVVTNSIQVAQVFHTSQTPGPTVVLTGGVRTPSDALVGPIAVSSLAQLHLDVLFLGVHGMSLRGGFTTPNLLEADLDRAFVAAARQLVVVADHTKWGVVGISTIARLDQADVLITDEGLPSEAADQLEAHVGQLVLARVRSSGQPADGSHL